MENIDIIKSRIKKLLKHAESAKNLGSIHEAELFAAKATELITEYNLNLLEILSFNNEKEDFSNYMYGETLSYRDNQASHGWRYRLCQVITKHNFCNFTYKSYIYTLRIYGRVENVDTCVFLYNYLSIAILRIGQEKWKNSSELIQARYTRFKFLKDFCIGAVQGINNQLKKQKEAQSEKISALILYNDKALGEFLKIENPDIKIKSGVKKTKVGAGYHIGFEAGEKMKIQENRITESEVTKSKLLS
jgi:hypothetical protein